VKSSFLIYIFNYNI